MVGNVVFGRGYPKGVFCGEVAMAIHHCHGGGMGHVNCVWCFDVAFGAGARQVKASVPLKSGGVVFGWYDKVMF